MSNSSVIDDLNKPALNKLSTRTLKRDQATWLEYSKDGY